MYTVCCVVVRCFRNQSMGGGSSKLSSSVTELMKCWKARKGATGGFEGGDEGYFGGDFTDEKAEKAMEEIAQYRSTLSAKFKQDVVQGIAQALKQLGMAIDPNASMKEIAETIKQKLPNPSVNGRAFKVESSSQKELCELIAKHLNSVFTPGAEGSNRLIDLREGPANVCRAVFELTQALATGAQTEFLKIQAQVRKALRNIEIFDLVMQKMYNKVIEKAKLSADEKTALVIDRASEVYKKADQLRLQQFEILKGLLDTTLGPAEKELLSAMRKFDTSRDKIESLLGEDLEKIGTQDFSQGMSEVFQSLGVYAYIADLVDKSLEKTGISLEQYTGSKDMKEFEKLVDDKEKSRKTMKDLDEFVNSINVLKSQFKNREKIKKIIKQEETGADMGPSDLDVSGGDDDCGCGAVQEGFQGGDEPKTVLEKQIDTEADQRRLIVTRFVEVTNDIYAKLLKDINAMASKIGKEIPITDKLRDLRDAMIDIQDIDLIKISIALIGLSDRAAERASRDRFNSRIQTLLEVLDEIMSLKAYEQSLSLFAAVREDIKSLNDTIDHYSDIVKSKYGGADKEYDASVLHKSSFDLKTAIITFKYHFYIADMYENLDSMKGEFTGYTEKYGEILGEAVAAKLADIKKKYDNLVAEIKQVQDDPAINLGGGIDAEAKKKAIDYIGKKLKEEYETKKNFYYALQAIDIYLKEFAKAVVAHPKDILEVRKMLEGIQVIARWYNDASGNALVNAFEQFRSLDPARNVLALSQDINVTDDHYYKMINGTALGIPFIPLNLKVEAERTKNDKVKENISKVVDNFQALKNILNAFARIGDKFGGVELYRQTSMGPSKIYEALRDFLKSSAVSHGLGNDTFAHGINMLAAGAVPQLNAGAAVVVTNNANFDHLFSSYFSSIQNNINVAQFDLMGGNFKDEHTFFWYMMKAIAAKIMTVLDVYDLLNKPGKIGRDAFDVRTIVGGAIYQPKIIPEATELYFRIVRLYEFYKKFFDLKEKRQNDSQKNIFFISGLDGKFAKLTRLIIDSPVEDGTYTDYDAYEIIGEINSLYTQFAEEYGKENVVKKFVEAIIKDVNQRYGYLKKSEFEKYMNELDATGPKVSSNPHETNYSILPGEGEYAPAMSGPSDRYELPAGIAERNPLTGKYDIGNDPRDKLVDFRDRFERMFADEPSDQFKDTLLDITYHDVIAQAKKDMELEQDEDKRRKIALRLIQSSNTMLKADRLNYLMFHETVVTSVTMLKSIKKVFENYRQMVILTDVKGMTEVASEYFSDAGHYATLQAIGAAADARTVISPIIVGRINENDGDTIGIDQAKINEFLFNTAVAAGTDGRGGYVADFALNDITAIFPAAPPPPADIAKYLATYLRLVMNYQKMMKYMLTVLLQMSLDLDDKFKVEFTDSPDHPIHINSTGLENMVDDLMSYAKDYLNKFRRIIHKDTVHLYEDTLKTLEDQLVDVFIRPQKSLRGVTVGNSDKHTLKQLEMRLNNAFNMMIKPHAYSPVDTFGNPPAALAFNALTEGIINDRTEHYAQVLAGFLFYDATINENSGLSDVGAFGRIGTLGALPGVRSFNSDLSRFKELFQNRPENQNPLDGNDLYLLDIFGVNWNHRNESFSMLLNFNRFIVNYLRTFTSDTDIKIYVKLIDSFVNGAFSEQVLTLTNAYPDIYIIPAPVGNNPQNNLRFGRRGDPKANNLLFASVAVLLQNIMLTKISQTKPNRRFVNDSMAEIPLYMKERFKADLPVFKKLFTMLIKEGNYFNQLINKTKISLQRTHSKFVNNVPNASMYNGNNAFGIQVAGVGDRRRIVIADLIGNRGGGANHFCYVVNDAIAAGFYNGQNLIYRWGNQLHELVPDDNNELNSNVVSDRFIGIISQLTAGSSAIISCIDGVMAELGDSGKYCEVADNSIESFKSLNGKLPLMPTSLIQLYLRDVNDIPTDMFPKDSVITPEFKILYGVRKLLNDQKAKVFDYKDMPWLKYAFDAFLAQSKKAKISEADLMKYMNLLVSGMRYFTSLRNYGYIFRSVGLVIPYVAFNDLVDFANDNEISYPLNRLGGNREPVRVIEVVENINPDDKIDDIIKMFNINEGKIITRIGEIRANIVDLNIVPINVHALMRSIPLAPTYNYAYSFEKMVCAMFRKIRKDVTARDVANPFKDTRELFARLMIDPGYSPAVGFIGSHTRINGANGLMYRLMRGNDALGLGRPKYISDQIFNKALLGNIYPYGQSLDESGVGASQALHMTHMLNDNGTDMSRDTQYNRLNVYNKVNITRKQMVKYVSDIFDGLRKRTITVNAGLLSSFPAKPSNVTDDMYTRINTWFQAIAPAQPGVANVNVSGVIIHTPIVPQNANGQVVFTRAGVVVNIIDFATNTEDMNGLPADWTLAELSRNANPATINGGGGALNTLRDLLEHLIAPNGNNLGRFNGVPVPDFRDIHLYVWANVPLTLTPANTLVSFGAEISDQALRLTYIGKEPNQAPDYAPQYDPSDPRSYVYYSDKVFTIDERTNLDIIGTYRMNTHLVRNLMFITNVWRVLRAELDRKATEFKTVLVKDEQLINPSLAEFNDSIEERQFKYLMEEDI